MVQHQPDLDYTCISIGGGESLGSSQKVLSCFTISSKISFLDLWLQLSLSATAWSCLMASEHMEQSSPCNAMEFTRTNLNNWKSKLLTFLIKHFTSVTELGYSKCSRCSWCINFSSWWNAHFFVTSDSLNAEWLITEVQISGWFNQAILVNRGIRLVISTWKNYCKTHCITLN